MNRLRDERFTPLVRHANRGRIQVEKLDHRLRDRVERGVKREAPRERVRDLEQPPELAGRLSLRSERPLEDQSELLRPLVQPRVLDRHRQLARKSKQEPLLLVPKRSGPATVDPERSDHVVLNDKWDEQRPPDPDL